MDVGLKGRLRRRALAAAAFAITAHLAILGLFLYSTPCSSPEVTEGPAISLDIVESPIVLKPSVSRPLTAQSFHPLTTRDTQKARSTDKSSLTQLVPAGPSLQAPPASPRTFDTVALGKALRGSIIGCNNADLANLTGAERQNCRDSFIADRGNTADLSQFAIPPEKRAIFDAAWTADHSPQHMAGVACLAVFGGGKLKWLRPSEGVKLGPLPCYVYTPKATFFGELAAPSRMVKSPGAPPHQSG